MDFDEYQREVKLEEYARQFDALHGLGLDAAALTAVARPDTAQMAGELRDAASLLGPQYAAMPPSLRGVALARMLAVVAHLFDLGQSLACRSRASCAALRATSQEPEEDLLLHLPELLPQIRGCAKFLSDEIAAYALCLVQDEERTKAAAAAAFRQDCRLIDQTDADHRLAQMIHGRDAAYAASRAHLYPPRPAGEREFGDDPWSDPELEDEQGFDLALDGRGLGEYPAEDDGSADEYDETEVGGGVDGDVDGDADGDVDGDADGDADGDVDDDDALIIENSALFLRAARQHAAEAKANAEAETAAEVEALAFLDLALRSAEDASARKAGEGDSPH